MTFPAPFEQDFLDDLPYDPSALFLDRIESLDVATRTLVCRMPTDVPLPLTEAQRVHPTKHPKHVSGGLILHVTGMLGFVYAYHVHGWKHSEGWTGYGTHIHNAVFRKLATIGPPISCQCVEKKKYQIAGRFFCTFEFTFRQQGEVVFESKQSAIWVLAPATDQTRSSRGSEVSLS